MSHTTHAPRFIPPTVEELDCLFPSHTITSFIAQGGMGAVYLGEQTSLERPVAIKILPREFSGDPDYVTSFHSEAKAMAKVSHSNLVGIFDFGNVDGMLYIIMEFVPGRALFDVANGKAVEELEAAHLIIEMSRGLAQAHKAGIIHRDIKPANVLIDDKGSPKIVDFGLAKPHGDDAGEGVIFGTPGYTAPEVITNPHAVDQKSDLYSIGAMLYELLTGTLPKDPYVSPSDASGCDTRFDIIVARALQPDPQLRTESAEALITELDSLIRNFTEEPKEETPVHTGPRLMTAASNPTKAPIAPQPITPLKSSKGNGTLSILLLLGIAGIGGYLYWDYTQKNNEASPAESQSNTSKEDTQIADLAIDENTILPMHQFRFSDGPKKLKDSLGKARILDGEGVSYRNGRVFFSKATKRAPRVLIDKKVWQEASEVAFEFWVTWRDDYDHQDPEYFFSISSKQGKTKDAITARSINLYPNYQGSFALRAKINRQPNQEPITVFHTDENDQALPFPTGGSHHIVVNLSPSKKLCQVYLDGDLAMELKTKQLNLASLSQDGLVFFIGQDSYASSPSFIGSFQQLNIHYKTLSADEVKLNRKKALVKSVKP